MNFAHDPPHQDELELTVFGPGYGESMALHIGSGDWIIVDSCIDDEGQPRALQYLKDLGVKLQANVRLIVATHWHDDHIRGISELLQACTAARFCCASALTKKEFLSMVGAMEIQSRFGIGFGLRELYRVFNQLQGTGERPVFAIANRRIFHRNDCEVWSLSPDDGDIVNFLHEVGQLIPKPGQSKRRIPSGTPNMISVALWVKIGDAALLLGADLEQRGWKCILKSDARPSGKASLFKIPHHGSKTADLAGVWTQMLDAEPWAVLTPWRLGRGSLPKQSDVRRILSYTSKAYSTASLGSLSYLPVKDRLVKKITRESHIKIQSLRMASGAIRMRKPAREPADWNVHVFEPACGLAQIHR